MNLAKWIAERDSTVRDAHRAYYVPPKAMTCTIPDAAGASGRDILSAVNEFLNRPRIIGEMWGMHVWLMPGTREVRIADLVFSADSVLIKGTKLGDAVARLLPPIPPRSDEPPADPQQADS